VRAHSLAVEFMRTRNARGGALRKSWSA
jgi:hypothetical protein